MKAARNEWKFLEDIPVAATFESFYRDQYRPVLALAIVLTRDRSAAEELTQDAFLAALRQWNRVGSMENPGAWVRRVVANRAVSRFRRGLVEVRLLAKFRSPNTVAGPEIANSIDVWRAVRQLPRRQAQVIALVYVNDLSRRQVAEVLGCSEETVKTHLDRARQKLSEHLAEGNGS